MTNKAKMDSHKNFIEKLYLVAILPRPPPCLIVFKPPPNMGCGFFYYSKSTFNQIRTYECKSNKKAEKSTNK